MAAGGAQARWHSVHLHFMRGFNGDLMGFGLHAGHGFHEGCMVIIGKNTFLLTVGLVGNPHLTAEIQFFAPLPTSTKAVVRIVFVCENLNQ